MNNTRKPASEGPVTKTWESLIFSPDSTPADKRMGFRLLNEAIMRDDPTAGCMAGRMLLDGTVSASSGDNVSAALDLLRRAAARGYTPARAILADYCRKKYDRAFPEQPAPDQLLTDFDGKPFRIRRTGVLTPVDATLEYKDGMNVLTLSLNLVLMDEGANVADPDMLWAAINLGIKTWEGVYTVFGGQQLQVDIRITRELRAFDSVIIALMDGTTLDIVDKALKLTTPKRASRIKQTIRDKRSMAAGGFMKWSVRSKKVIYLHSTSTTGRFDDYGEIMHTVKHEFGHVLGVGDLYKEAEAGRPGVPAGTYPELDPYILNDRFYNLVMCDHHGPISNNDIEMVVLAFAENRMQEYQQINGRGRVSKALGRGN